MAKRRTTSALTFEQELSSYLINPKKTISGSLDTLEGYLNLGTRRVFIRIILPQSILSLRQKPPRVFCVESFMKFGDEWHNSKKTGMCYVIDLEWLKYMGWKGKSRDRVIKESAKWLIQASKNLIARHRVATKKGYLNWPVEWNCWEHHAAGQQQFRKENQQNEK